MEGDDSSGGEDGRGTLEKLASKLNTFLTDARTIKTGQYLVSMAHLCHHDTQLAHQVWVDLFPRIWTALSESQREVSVHVYWYTCRHSRLMGIQMHDFTVLFMCIHICTEIK